MMSNSLTPKGKKFVAVLFILVIGGGLIYVHHAGLLDGFIKKSPNQFVESAATPQQVQQQVAQVPDTAPAPTQQAFAPTTDSMQSITQNHTIRVSVENPSDPIYDDKNGVVTGFNYEFLQLLVKQPEFAQGGPITIDTKSHEVDTYDAVTKQLLLTTNGAPVVDIGMDGITRADGDPAGVAYTNPYLTDFGYALVVQKGSPIRTAADLNGKTVGILQGDPDVKAYAQKQFPNTTFVEVSDSGGDNFIAKAIDGHTVDAFIYDYPFAGPLVNGTDLKFAITKLDGSNIAYKIGVRATDQNLLFRLNSAIGRVMQSSAYNDLLRKYFISDQIVTTAATSGERTYLVKQGDTLNSIAYATLGSGGRYRDIQQRNNLPNPNLILVGQHLVIPAR
jgi:ABC-type amino acid transport substrate-binding protein